jgi:hypothetical protein
MNVSETIESEEFHEHVQAGLSELVRRSLIQLGDMEEVKDRAHRIAEELAKITPPPRNQLGNIVPHDEPMPRAKP